MPTLQNAKKILLGMRNLRPHILNAGVAEVIEIHGGLIRAWRGRGRIEGWNRGEKLVLKTCEKTSRSSSMFQGRKKRERTFQTPFLTKQAATAFGA